MKYVGGLRNTVRLWNYKNRLCITFKLSRLQLGQRRNFRAGAAWVLNHAYLCRKLFGGDVVNGLGVYR